MKRVLIVDDEPHVTHVLKLFLERAGYATQTCPDGQAALAAILESPPDALITDIQMPLMTGKQLCIALEEQHPKRSFPILVMTSMTDRDHHEWTSHINKLELLEKPLSMRAVVVTLEKYFAAVPAPQKASDA